MAFPISLPPHAKLRTLAEAVSRLAVSIAASFHVEHKANGRHTFPWVTEPFVAARFTGWTATTQRVLRYTVCGQSMTVAVDVTGTATAVSFLSITIPGGYTAAVSVPSAGTFAYADAGTPGTGICIASGQQLNFYKNVNATVWTAGTANVQGTIVFEVQ